MVALPENKNKKKHLANESYKTKKAREKLQKRLEELDAKCTAEALAAKANEIQRWISRHSEHRIPLKDKDIRLFDENQNAAKVSLRVSKIAERLRTGVLPE